MYKISIDINFQISNNIYRKRDGEKRQIKFKKMQIKRMILDLNLYTNYNIKAWTQR